MCIVSSTNIDKELQHIDYCFANLPLCVCENKIIRDQTL